MKFKLTKKTLYKYWFIYIILGIIASILIIGGHFNLFSLTGVGIESTNTELITDSQERTNYEFSFVSQPTSPYADCGMSDKETFNLIVPTIQTATDLPEFTDLIENTNTLATSVRLDGIRAMASMCSASQREINVILNNTKATCQVKNNGYSPPGAEITCTITGDAYPSENGQLIKGKIFGLTGGKIDISFPKVGYCPIGQTKCSDGLCKTSCSECPENQIKCNGICKNSCDENNLLIMLVIFIMGGIVFLLYRLYVKTRKKR